MIKLAQPNIPGEAIGKVIEILRSGNLVQGEYVEDFEQKLAEYNGVRHAIAVSSGTAALHLSLLALDIKEGDEVIVPAFTFPATANVVELVGAKPVFVDIDLSDFCIDVNKIEEVVSKDTKAIIPVHEFGQAAKMNDIINIAQRYGLKIIEDAACALGTEFENKKAGTFGELGCFSFHPRKTITTGEGGAVVTEDDNLARKIIALRNHGIEISKKKMDFKYAGLNYRMTDFQAAIGIPQLATLELQIGKRDELAKGYDKVLAPIDRVKTPKRFPERKTVYQTYHILTCDCSRDAVINVLNEHGIQSNFGANALHMIQFYKEKYKYVPHDFRNSEIAYNQGLALPMSVHLCYEDIEKIGKVVKSFS